MSNEARYTFSNAMRVFMGMKPSEQRAICDTLKIDLSLTESHSSAAMGALRTVKDLDKRGEFTLTVDDFLNSPSVAVEGREMRAKVVLRKINPSNSGELKPEALQLEGQILGFTYGWRMGADDPYPSEDAWIANKAELDKYQGMPIWIASGDLEAVEDGLIAELNSQIDFLNLGFKITSSNEGKLKDPRDLYRKAVLALQTNADTISKDDLEIFAEMILEPINDCRQAYNMSNAGSTLSLKAGVELNKWVSLEGRIKQALEAK